MHRGLRPDGRPHGAPEPAPGSLGELTRHHPLLAALRAELAGVGARIDTTDALVDANVDPSVLEAFFSLVAREARPETRFGLGLSLLPFVARHQIGCEAAAFVLARGAMADYERGFVGMRLARLAGPSLVPWCHWLLVTVVRNDTAYQTFLSVHGPSVVRDHLDAMTEYLLVPDRGPAGYNIDAFACVLGSVPDPRPFLLRWFDWINDGRFDRASGPGSEHVGLVYAILDSYAGEAWVPLVAEAIETQIHVRLLASDPAKIREGLHQLAVMCNREYGGIGRVLHRTVPAVRRLPPAEARVWPALVALLEATWAYVTTGSAAWSAEASARRDRLLAIDVDAVATAGPWIR